MATVVCGDDQCSNCYLTVAFVLEGSPEPVGVVHRICEDNVPPEEDGMEILLDGGPIPENLPKDCMYCTDDS